MKDFKIVLVISNSTCGAFNALNFVDVEESMTAFLDIKEKGRKSLFLKDIQNDNIAGISFSSKEPISVTLDAEDHNTYRVPNMGNLLGHAQSLGYTPISI